MIEITPLKYQQLKVFYPHLLIQDETNPKIYYVLGNYQRKEMKMELILTQEYLKNITLDDNTLQFHCNLSSTNDLERKKYLMNILLRNLKKSEYLILLESLLYKEGKKTDLREILGTPISSMKQLNDYLKNIEKCNISSKNWNIPYIQKKINHILETYTNNVHFLSFVQLEENWNNTSKLSVEKLWENNFNNSKVFTFQLPLDYEKLKKFLKEQHFQSFGSHSFLLNPFDNTQIDAYFDYKKIKPQEERAKIDFFKENEISYLRKEYGGVILLLKFNPKDSDLITFILDIFYLETPIQIKPENLQLLK